MRILVHCMFHVHHFQRGSDACIEPTDALLAAEYALDREHHVARASQPRQQTMVLKNHRPLRRRAGDFALVAEQNAAARQRQPGNQIEQRRFAATGVPNQRDNFAFTHRQIDVLQRDEFSLFGVKSLADALDFEQ